ncbi:hypothetical protein DSECCO2_635490 [anaerobic digester metagenome]
MTQQKFRDTNKKNNDRVKQDEKNIEWDGQHIENIVGIDAEEYFRQKLSKEKDNNGGNERLGDENDNFRPGCLG